MYVTDTPVIDRLINPEPMEELYRTHDDIVEYVLNQGFPESEESDVLHFVDAFKEELATRLAAIQ